MPTPPAPSRSRPALRPGVPRAVLCGLAALLVATAGCSSPAASGPDRAVAGTSAPGSPGPTGSPASPGTGGSPGPSGPASGTASTPGTPTGTPPLGTGGPGASATPGPGGSPTARQLPRGGTELFPRYRLVGFSGGESSRAFGRLGVGKLDARVREIERTGRAYTAGGREVLPVLELITVIVHASPGADGKYRSRIDDAQIGRHLAAARRHRALLLLNIQPGRADFLPEVKALKRWLAEPDVGIALDPEWAVGPGQTPGRVYGRTTAKELNAVAAWLSEFTRSRDLPEKAMVVHQLAPRIIHRIQNVRAHPGVEIVLSVDGIGSRGAKESTWRRLVKPLPPAVRPGFKLFFEEDREHGRLMTPRQVLALEPRPDYVLYE